MRNLLDLHSSKPSTSGEGLLTPDRNQLMGSAEPHMPLNRSQLGVLNLRTLRQFKEACFHLAKDTQRAIDPLDGLRTAMQRLVEGDITPRVRFSHFANYEDGGHIAVRCRAVATSIVRAIHPISDSPSDSSASEAFDRALAPISVLPTRQRAAGKRVGYRVDTSLLASALAGLDAITDDAGPDAPIRTMPISLRHISTSCLLTFRPHLTPESFGMYVAVRYQPRELTDYAATSGWVVVGKAQIDAIVGHRE